jgi:phosphate/sulfate permease
MAEQIEGTKMKLWHRNGNFDAFKWLWWAAAGGSLSALFQLLSHYLIQLANPWPIIGLVFFGFGTRAFANLAGDIHDRAGKTIFLLALTSILAVVFAMYVRPLFVEVLQEAVKSLDEAGPITGLEWAREYIEPFKAKVVGYIGFYVGGYFFAYKLVARLGKYIPLLAYPRTKAELHAAFWEAAGQIPGVPLDAIDNQAKLLLNEHKGSYGGRRPLTP